MPISKGTLPFDCAPLSDLNPTPEGDHDRQHTALLDLAFTQLEALLAREGELTTQSQFAAAARCMASAQEFRDQIVDVDEQFTGAFVDVAQELETGAIDPETARAEHNRLLIHYELWVYALTAEAIRKTGAKNILPAIPVSFGAN